jgi:murein DD-endopeptidase MepM/ murein hydrolase activator NlpD
MRCVSAPPLVRYRLALVAATAFGIAGCSSDMSRFTDGPVSATGARPSGEISSSAQQKPNGAISSTTLLPPPAPQSTPVAPPSTPNAVSNVPVKPDTSAPAPNNMSVHVVAAGDTLNKIARQHRISLKELIAVNKMSANAKLKLGERLNVPTSRVAQPSAPKVLAELKPNTNQSPSNAARKITPTPEVAETKSLSGAASLSFRLPVRGRVIAGFGPKPSGQENHGINFAVPEGTPVKAAEDGVVVYANNELKSYGNLVLIRHANGFVTAYAHVSEIMVKRDDVVKRGQVIAKSGQTGNVASPQLHFEIRKGSVPVDPMPYLDRSPQA